MRHFPRRVYLFVFLFLLFFYGVFSFVDLRERKESPTPRTTPLVAQSESGRVMRVIDGDTLRVSLGANEETVRIIGINAPEIAHPQKSPQCYGAEATLAMKELSLGKLVRLKADPTQNNRDIYGRLLRYVYFDDGISAGVFMIQNGFAFEYTYHTPYIFQTLYRNAEDSARTQLKGFWNPVSQCTIITVHGRKETNTL